METHLDSLAQDFRYALRNLRKNPRFSLIAISALALGIGATTVMFSVSYSAVVDALPYKNFERSVVFRIQNLANVGGRKLYSTVLSGGSRKHYTACSLLCCFCS